MIEDKIRKKLSSILLSSNDYEEAAKEFTRFLVHENKIDYAIIWLKNDEEILQPYYWTCPYDLTDRQHTDDGTIVYQCYKKPQIIALYSTNSSVEQLEENINNRKRKEQTERLQISMQ